MLEYFELIAKACPRPAEAPCPRSRRKELEALARDKEFLGTHAITGDSVEGYLFPDTYEFRVNEKPRARARAADHAPPGGVERAASRKHPQGRSRSSRTSCGWTDRDILTMASIVEKEAVEPSERPRIAQVFINRLTRAELQAEAARDRSDDPLRLHGAASRSRRRASRGTSRARSRTAAGLRSPAPRAARRQGQPVQHVPARGPAAGADREPGPQLDRGGRSRPTAATIFYFVAKNDREHAFAQDVRGAQENVDKYMKGN